MLVVTALTLSLGVVQDPQESIPLPMQAGLSIVQAVTDDAYQGRDYEAVVTIGSVVSGNVALQWSALLKDRGGQRRWLTARRTVLADDIRRSRTQILGFDTEDPERLPGTTGLGPSRLVIDELNREGRASVVVRNYAARRDNSGTLERVGNGSVAFPVLLNGMRVSVPAIHARGELGLPGSMRPWDFWFLDHPVQPLTLKVLYGPEAAREAGPPEWKRQIVRIDFPDGVVAATAGAESDGTGSGSGEFDFETGVGTPGGSGVEAEWGSGAGAGARRGGDAAVRGEAGIGAGAGAAGRLERQLAVECRVPVPGIYFEFDSDQLNPASRPWIRSVADLLHRHPDWTVTIEGHTDSIGGASYNLDLSTRRAGALKRSLTDEHRIAAPRLATRGFGPTRPLESNATVEGRARNRRVELVRPCDRSTR
jgi:outer membrane protein OmpA-like peptidoglycan-associated protein